MAYLHSVQVDYHQEITNGHRVKVSILDLGLYINGFRVYEPNKEKKKDWIIFPPQYFAAGKRFNVVEFDKSKSLWVEVRQACIDCVNEILNNKQLDINIVQEKVKERQNGEAKNSSPHDISVPRDEFN
jgi:hypothetical protein